MVRNVIFIVAVAVFISISCTKEPVTPHPSPSESGSGIFICNEGNFTFGNASLSYYSPEKSEVQNNLFQLANSFPLGDVVQSITIKDSLAFLTINNSGKIFVMHTGNYKHVATISGLTSPRYIQFINETKAYVSDIYSRSMTIIDSKTFEVTGHITIGNSTEQMVKHGDFVYVTSWYRHNKIYKIDARTDEVTDSLPVKKQPNSIVLDKNNKLWVLCDGGYVGIAGGKDSAALYQIQTASFSIEKQFTFPVWETSPSELQLNNSGDTLFYIDGSWGRNAGNAESGIYRMPVNTVTLPPAPFIAENDHLFYGLGIDPRTSEIYVSDAIDYQQNGWVYRYSPTASLVDSFKVGIIPGSFAFKQQEQ